ncbi:MAG: hypothetical protein Satyrvirus7_15 [Satyrvirus sp.]|uniref:Uncharacterized protein n=1 Tax=Satyrvirus sp. TaxID=2487771 RepID=A0A3G5AG16_9VIRU|nr:MAG: hypothetical protein Satyrvirus7_15 [Satyrvirus sp.]
MAKQLFLFVWPSTLVGSKIQCVSESLESAQRIVIDQFSKEAAEFMMNHCASSNAPVNKSNDGQDLFLFTFEIEFVHGMMEGGFFHREATNLAEAVRMIMDERTASFKKDLEETEHEQFPADEATAEGMVENK